MKSIQAQLRREAEEKPEVPPPVFNLFGGKGKVPASLWGTGKGKAEEKPEVPPPVFNLFTGKGKVPTSLFGTGKGKSPAPAPKGVDVGVNTEEAAEPAEKEEVEHARPDPMVGVVGSVVSEVAGVPAAHAGGRRRTSPAAIGESASNGGGGPRWKRGSWGDG